MQYQMQYNVCAIVICFVILFTHLMRKKTKEYHNIIFTLIVLSTLIGAFNNILNTVGNMKIVEMNQTLLDGFNYLYFFSLNLPPPHPISVTAGGATISAAIISGTVMIT